MAAALFFLCKANARAALKTLDDLPNFLTKRHPVGGGHPKPGDLGSLGGSLERKKRGGPCSRSHTHALPPPVSSSLSLILRLPPTGVGRAHRVQVQQQRVGVEEDAVGTARDGGSDLAGRFDATERKESRVARQRLADQTCRLGLALFVVLLSGLLLGVVGCGCGG